MEKAIVITVNALILIGLLVFAWGFVFFIVAMEVNPFGRAVEVLACISVSASAGAIHQKIKIR